MKSYVAKQENVQREWYIVDATDKPAGRLAVEIATVLRGKHKPTFTPHVDTGDFVVVINAKKVKLSGRKEEQKIYKHYTGWNSGLREYKAKLIREKNPERIVMQAVKGMLPKTKLAARMLTRLKVFPGAEHNHEAQQPKDFAEKSKHIVPEKQAKTASKGTGAKKAKKADKPKADKSADADKAAAEKAAAAAAAAADKAAAADEAAAAAKAAAADKSADAAKAAAAAGAAAATAAAIPAFSGVPAGAKEDEKLGIIYESAPDQVDDLTEISGVGPVLEGKLNAFGVYTFQQIANWKPAVVAEFDDLLDFPGRIERDDWIAKASELHAAKHG